MIIRMFYVEPLSRQWCLHSEIQKAKEHFFPFWKRQRENGHNEIHLGHLELRLKRYADASGE